MRARTGAYSALAVVSWLFVACILVQVFLAGMGVFDGAGAFITHRNFGYVFGWLTLLMVGISIVGRLPRRLVGLSLLALLQFALQSVFILFRDDQPAVAALHPLNGVLLLVVAIAIGRLALAGRRAGLATQVGDGAASLEPAEARS